MSNPTVNWLTYLLFERILKRLKHSETWRGKIKNLAGFFKEDKEAFNLMVFVFFKVIMLEPDEKLDGFLPYVLKRLLIKAEAWDSKPRNKKFYKENAENFDSDVSSAVLNLIVSEFGDDFDNTEIKEFIEFLEVESAKISPEVERVYKAARTFATLIEYEEVKDDLRPDSVVETKKDIEVELEQYMDLPHFAEMVFGDGEYGKIKDLITAISWSRYTIRWQGYNWHPRCSILTHMLESAVIGYLADIELGRDSDWNHDFEVMMFHDIAEVWTDDIPGPLKNKVKFSAVSDFIRGKVNKEEVTLRDVSDIQELMALDEKFYPLLPSKLESYFRDGIMLADVKTYDDKKFFKMADYFSADLEVWWNIRDGSRDKFCKSVFNRSLDKEYRTPEQRRVLLYFLSICENITFI